MQIVMALLIGLIFGTGISISGMGNPAKVLNFFDFAGTWDPSLALVMASGVIVTAIGFRLVLARPAPALDKAFNLPTNRAIDKRLVVGSAIFGVGWGITGFCPGGAIPALGSDNFEVVVFVISMVAGMAGAMAMQLRSARKAIASKN